ncbi:hypothetical protein F0562_024198 [Nyssa sinensis]|uniref:MORF/ORRM1/DAG-like MORF domain-containing protein n=1 Tax=Nyssa sinensis TaxID=561372 RepID=A0A5J5BBY9_9ASTE|nr:hypothetical protein F0562_024198 [Nyssa sinensis]
MNSLLKDLYKSSGKPITLKDHLSTVSLNVISRMVLGKRYLDEAESSIVTPEEFKKMLDELFLLNGVFNIGDSIPWIDFLDLQGYVKRMKVLSKKFDLFLEHVIDEHNATRMAVENYVAKDMVDVLLQLADDPNLEIKLERHGVKAFTQDLLAGGTESSAVTVEWAISEILKRPEIFKKATEELDRWHLKSREFRLSKLRDGRSSQYNPSFFFSRSFSSTRKKVDYIRCLQARPVDYRGNSTPTQGSELTRVATLVNGCDYHHWLVVMEPPNGYPLRHEIVHQYIKTLTVALGSEEEAKKSIYSVSTKYYYAFGCRIPENVTQKIKSLPHVRWVLPDSYLCPRPSGKDEYGGEPFVDGEVVPYNEMYHADWLRDQNDDNYQKITRSRKARRKEKRSLSPHPNCTRYNVIATAIGQVH